VLTNDVKALAPVSAGGLTCRVCGMPDPTCHHGLDHSVDRIGLKYRQEIDAFLREQENHAREFDRVFGA
jgi:hypothetical protein